MQHRRITHLSNARRGRISRFYSAIREYGEDHFDWRVLEECPVEILLERETFWIEEKNSASIGGFNVDKNPIESNVPSSLGKPKSEITKALLSLKNKGRKRSPESIEKIRAAHLGKKRTPEQCANISKGKLASKFKYSDESKKKMSLAKLGKKCGPMSNEQKQKISNSKKGKPNGWLGKKFSPEHIMKRQMTRYGYTSVEEYLKDKNG